jgi:hypothetical protein
MEFQAEIFTPEKTKFIFWRSFNLSITCYIIAGLIGYGLINFNISNSIIKNLLEYHLVLVFLVGSIGCWIWSFSEKELLKGKLDGKIQFTTNQIIVNDLIFQIPELTEILFFTSFYLDEYNNESVKSTFAKNSQGVENYVAFTFQNKQYKIFYQVSSIQHLYQLTQYIISLKKNNSLVKLKFNEKRRKEILKELQQET